MRTRLLIATAVSMFVIGAASLSVNYTNLFSAFAQDAEAGQSAEAIPASMETVTEETVVSEDAANMTDMVVEAAAESTDVAVEAAVDATETNETVDAAHDDHAETTDAVEEAVSETTPEN